MANITADCAVFLAMVQRSYDRQSQALNFRCFLGVDVVDSDLHTLFCCDDVQ